MVPVWHCSPSVPMALKGRYQKYVLAQEDEKKVFLFKAYPGPSDALPRAAEVSASQFYLLFDPEHSTEVSPFEWNGISGTLQTYFETAVPAQLKAIEHSRQLAATVRRRQVLDWTISNHDNHISHILMLDQGTVFVDYGQAFKFFPNDRLCRIYHPNALVKQSPPIYNLMKMTVHLPDEVLSMIDRVSSASRSEMTGVLENYLQIRCPDRRSRTVFMDSIYRRIDELPKSFKGYYGTGDGRVELD